VVVPREGVDEAERLVEVSAADEGAEVAEAARRGAAAAAAGDAATRGTRWR